jgi:hypothetical protein
MSGGNLQHDCGAWAIWTPWCGIIASTVGYTRAIAIGEFVTMMRGSLDSGSEDRALKGSLWPIEPFNGVKHPERLKAWEGFQRKGCRAVRVIISVQSAYLSGIEAAR